MESIHVFLRNKTLGDEHDEWRWKLQANETFSVKSFYSKLLRSHREFSPPLNPFPYKLVWDPPIPTNVKFFLWTLLLGRVLTADNLLARGITVDANCVFCKEASESIFHLFMGCTVINRAWQSLSGHVVNLDDILHQQDIKGVLESWPKQSCSILGNAVWQILPYAFLWCTWRMRNQGIFRGKDTSCSELIKAIKLTTWEWIE
ncbi:hypothetical protein FRX31_002888, partial [Thalictrum thalictroides]